MSLWKVNDDTTRQLMEAYYRNLLAGQGRATALREAMRSLRATRPHPHYWAPFIALGRDAPLRALTPSPQEDFLNDSPGHRLSTVTDPWFRPTLLTHQCGAGAARPGVAAGRHGVCSADGESLGLERF
jgi:hypothetical protein